jgi:hypothetical protein
MSSRTWLKVSISTRFYTKDRAIAVVLEDRERTKQERYIEAGQDSAEADKGLRSDMILDRDIEEEGQRRQAGDQRTF